MFATEFPYERCGTQTCCRRGMDCPCQDAQRCVGSFARCIADSNEPTQRCIKDFVCGEAALYVRQVRMYRTDTTNTIVHSRALSAARVWETLVAKTRPPR